MGGLRAPLRLTARSVGVPGNLRGRSPQTRRDAPAPVAERSLPMSSGMHSNPRSLPSQPLLDNAQELVHPDSRSAATRAYREDVHESVRQTDYSCYDVGKKHRSHL
jgi:hypothetical protein